MLNTILTFIWKQRTTILAGLVVLFAWLYFTKPEKVISVPADNTDLVQLTKEFKTLSGQLANVMKQQEISEAEAKIRFDSIAKELKVKSKFIKGEDVYHYSSTQRIDSVPYFIDSTNGHFSFKHEDPWLKISGNNINPEKKLTFDLENIDTLRVTQVRKPKLFKRSETEVFIMSSSPYSKIIAGYSVRVKDPKLWAVLGPGLSLDIKGNVTPSINLTVPLIQIRR